MKTHNVTINGIPDDKLKALQIKAERFSALMGVKVPISAYVRRLIDKDLMSAEEKLKTVRKGAWRKNAFRVSK